MSRGPVNGLLRQKQVKKGYQQPPDQQVHYSRMTRPRAAGQKVSPPDFRADAKHVENAGKKVLSFIGASAKKAYQNITKPPKKGVHNSRAQARNMRSR